MTVTGRGAGGGDEEGSSDDCQEDDDEPWPMAGVEHGEARMTTT